MLSLTAPCIAEDAPQQHPAVTFHQAPKPLPPDAVTEDWPAFLGPAGDNVCRETGLLLDWADAPDAPKNGPNLVWEMTKGSGYSAPSIVGRRLVFFHRLDDREVVECLDAETGGRFWQVDYPSTYRDRYGYSNGPRATPAIHDGRVYTYGVEGKLHCIDLASGDVIWQRDLKADYEIRQGFFGLGATPLIEGDLLIVNAGAPHVADGACVVAVNQLSGETVWQTGDQWGASYASPVAATVHGKRRVFVLTGGESRPPTGGLLCIDPADGRIDFRFPWRSGKFESVNAANPVIAGTRVFVTASYQKGGSLLDITPQFEHKLAWKTPKLGAHFATPIYHEGYLYGIDGRHSAEAAIVCIEAGTGREVWRFAPQWQQRYTAYGREHERAFGIDRGSLMRVGERFLCVGEMGHLLWLELSPTKNEIVARTWLFAAPDTWTPPVISRGLLYIVQHKRDILSDKPPRLLCYDLREG